VSAAPDQIELPGLSPLTEPDYAPNLSWAERFEIFHEANPHVAVALERLADQWLAHHRKVSMKALVERLRWESGIYTQGNAYRINNSFTAFYARLLIDRRPEWAGAIETRKAMADRSES
jgi:hypothetical protein